MSKEKADKAPTKEKKAAAAPPAAKPAAKPAGKPGVPAKESKPGKKYGAITPSDQGVAIGVRGKRGHNVTKRVITPKPSRRKGVLQKRTAVIRETIRDVVGYVPYEKRMMELLKGGGNNPQKRAWRFAKTRLGTHARAKRKVKEMEGAIDKIAQAAKKAAAASTK